MDFNNEFFEEILKKSFNGHHADVQNQQMQLLSKPGDSCEMYRAEISYTVQQNQPQKISLIVKSTPATEAEGEILDTLNAYDREVKMYCKTLPAMSELLDNEYFGPRCFHASLDPRKILVFQDLQVQNYESVKQKQGLDLAHSQLVVRKIGKFHAASMVLAERQPDVMKLYSFGVFNQEIRIPYFGQFFEGSLNSLIEEVSNWSGYESITEKLRKMLPNFVDRIYDHVKTENDEICVLNHGDLWINNMYFQYCGEGLNKKPVNLALVDYQLSFYTTPGIDLNYFLWTCPTNEVRQNSWCDLIYEYYDAFHSAMVTMEAKVIPTLDEMKTELKKMHFYGFVSCVSTLPLILMERTSAVDAGMDIVLDGEKRAKMQESMYGGAKYREAMQYNLKRFDEMHVLD